MLRITPAGGSGALTTGNGILVVDAVNGGTTAPGMFTLSGPVVAGPYEYDLFRSSTDTSNPNAWYLRDTINCSTAGAPTHLVRRQTHLVRRRHLLRHLARLRLRRHLLRRSHPRLLRHLLRQPEPVPHYRAEVSLYVALPSLAQLYGRALLDTLHERVGEEEDLQRPSECTQRVQTVCGAD